MELFSKMEIITMASVLGGMILIITLLTILDFVDEKRSKKKVKNTILSEEVKEEVVVKNEEVKDEVNLLELSKETTIQEETNFEEIEEIEILDFDEPVLEMKEEISNNEVIFEEVELTFDEVEYHSFNENLNELVEEENNVLVIENEQEKAKEELARLEVELEKEEDFSNTITNFELEQEENAIISYDELIKVSDQLYNQNEVVQYDDGDEPITIDEVIKRFSSTDMVFENTANLDKLNREIEGNDQTYVKVYENE